MRYLWNKCFIVLVVSLGFYGSLGRSHTSENELGATYTDEWAVHMPNVDEEGAKIIAQNHNFVYAGKIMPEYFKFKHNHVSKRSLEPSPHHHADLVEHPEVKWLEQQVIKRRVKRQPQFNDPKWPRMWYLKRGSNLDMNVMDAWRKGYTGRGVVVTILDDGIEMDHPDLKRNYDREASYDVNDDDPDPTPRYDYTNENRHGTRCAGEVAAEANNNICSVGVAYNASIGGVRMLDGDVTDAVEAKSLSLNPNHIDIYSASWGPDDDGHTVDGPSRLAKKAFSDGITLGRYGKGSIFVWASGNGGREGDSCNCDGYTNSIYTLSISSVTENGHIPWYSEACSSTLATTYSSGSGSERQIVTTDLRKGCTETHTGTSASAPLAAGICALALQANPNLTWRDMQHIVVLTARPAKLVANDWVTNGVGLKVSHHFGFGLMDASAMVDLALNWTQVPDQHMCEITSGVSQRSIGSHRQEEFRLVSTGCSDNYNNAVNYVEHVEAVITLAAERRGDVQIYLTSPKNTRSTLLALRTRDTLSAGFDSWRFMTTHNWGETSKGTWKLEIETRSTTAILRKWTLVLHGTKHQPYAQHESSPPTAWSNCVQSACTQPPSPPTEPPVVLNQVVLKNWSLVIYGTAEHPQSGPTQNTPPSTNIVHNLPMEGCSSGLFQLMNYGINMYNQGADNYCVCPECAEKEFLLKENCYSTCPQSFFPAFQTIGSNADVGVCLPCYEVCTGCTGKAADQCTECANGYTLVNLTCTSSFLPTSTTEPPGAQHYINIVRLGYALIALAILVFTLAFAIFHFCGKCSVYKAHRYAQTPTEDDLSANRITLPNGLDQDQKKALLSDSEESVSEDQNDVYTVDITDPLGSKLTISR